MSTAARAAIGVVAIAVAVVLFVVLQDSGSDDDAGWRGVKFREDSVDGAALTQLRNEPGGVWASGRIQQPVSRE